MTGTETRADATVLRALVEEERERFGVPGVAVAVVRDGEVLLCEGFGVRDVTSGEPVGPDTHFPIASDTKAFTAALLCQLADEGAVDLDAPVRSVVPWFEMHDPLATALVTPRDLLAHRTGLPRHDFVWYGDTDLTLEDVARRLRHLPLSRQPRQTWQYNNLCFNTAGYVTEVVTGQPWDEALRTRLLAPLGMRSTVLGPHDPSIKELAQPYKPAEGGPELQELPSRSKVGPAGGIVATATDMAQWLQARLGRRPEVLSEAALAQLHTPAMVGGTGMAAFDERQPMGYALGTQVESYRGHRVVRHGGNLVGYSSDVCVVPAAGIGVVVLTNLHGTALRDALALMVLDRLLGLEPVPWGERYHALMAALLQGKQDVLGHRERSGGEAPPSRPAEAFAGRYEHPAYGTFTIVAEGGQLVPDFHGLGDRHRLVHRQNDVWDLVLREFDLATPLVFEQGQDGSIASLTVAIEPTLPPLRFVRAQPTADADLLASLEGAWAMGPHRLVVRRRGEELLATVPLSGAIPLRYAGAERFTSPVAPSVVVHVERDEAGAVAALLVEPLGRFSRAG